MKKIKMLTIIAIIFIVVISFFSTSCYAESLGLGDKNQYISELHTPQKASKIVNNVLGIIQTIGTVVSVAILIVIGVKFMTGSVEEKAEYKQLLKPYIIGAIILFTGTFLPQFIYNITTEVLK